MGYRAVVGGGLRHGVREELRSAPAVCRALLGFFRTRTLALRFAPRGCCSTNASAPWATACCKRRIAGRRDPPAIMAALMTADVATWRTPFLVVGAIGMVWLVPWCVLLRGNDLRADTRKAGPAAPPPRGGRKRGEGAASPRASFWSNRVQPAHACGVLRRRVHQHHAWRILPCPWMPKFLPGRAAARLHGGAGRWPANSAWFIATDLGCLAAGALAVWLARRHPGRACRPGDRVRRLRGRCARPARSCRSSAQAGRCSSCWRWPARGRWASSRSTTRSRRDISAEHRGDHRARGRRGVDHAGAAPAGFGVLADRTGSFDLGLALAGLLPLLAS